MSNKSKRYFRKTSKRRSKKTSTRKGRKNKNRLAKGIETKNTNCCMCGKEINMTSGLIPRQCLIKYGANRAHRICQECWWDPVDGFAKEGTNHACPGCVKGLPLNGPAISGPIFVDLTED
jgi:hypothetical protein